MAPGVVGSIWKGCGNSLLCYGWATRRQKGLWKSQKFISAPSSPTTCPKPPKFSHLGTGGRVQSPMHLKGRAQQRWCVSPDPHLTPELSLGFVFLICYGKEGNMSLGNTRKAQKHATTHPLQQSIHGSVVKGENKKSMKLTGLLSS